jgi:hypothetical protein
VVVVVFAVGTNRAVSCCGDFDRGRITGVVTETPFLVFVIAFSDTAPITAAPLFIATGSPLDDDVRDNCRFKSLLLDTRDRNPVCVSGGTISVVVVVDSSCSKDEEDECCCCC